ncbi:MAG: hypothetical protein JNJ99_07835 [Crocinitomicaceae bacterium]|nr:hypothetical protein [Crocinitomicaceae bacterium]
MKQIKILLVGIILFGLSTSCKKEGCTDSTATNFDADAKKDDGSCIFPEPDPRDPYLGNYLVTDTLYLFGSFSEAVTYTLQVTTGGTSADTIYLNNLWNDGSNYFAIMAGNNFTIPSQQVSGPYYATGSGNFTSNVITYETSGDVYVNNGTGPKQ